MRKEPVTKLDLNSRLIKTNYEVEDIIEYMVLFERRKQNEYSFYQGKPHTCQ